MTSDAGVDVAAKPDPKPKSEPEEQPKPKPVPRCGRCMDSGIVATTFITDDGGVGSHVIPCTH